ncbi:MAG TPA: hypothetical protein EYH03_04885 [Chromatiales bacterium]|nr:hypothetical protein [Chromatiales bacterium]
MGLRTLIIILGILLVIHLVRRKYRQLKPPPGKKPLGNVDMVRCEVCGVHIPKPEAFERTGKYYCCKEHQNKGQND